MTKNAYVTLVATDIYAAGALVIAHRLRDFGSTVDLICLVTGDISATVLEHLSQLYKVIRVDTLKSTDEENLALLGRPELDITFTKLHLWSLTEYKKLVFLDADTLPFRNIDELFDRPNFSAAPDAGWPDCFNSGVFVTEPSDTDYCALKKMATEHGSFDGGDQGLLNRYFNTWSLSSSAHRLPFTYNTTPTSQYSYAPAHQYYANNIAICHFIGLNKPWKYQLFADGNVISHGWKGLTDLVQSWWDTWKLYYGQNLPHLLLCRPPKDTFLVPHATTPIRMFSSPVANAWDTQNITDDIELYNHRRRLGCMPPLENVTISTPKWAPQEMQASSYPGSSEIHTLASSMDENSQYSSHNNDSDSFDYVGSATDPSDLPDASALAFYDNKSLIEDDAPNQQNIKSNMNDNNDSSMYQTIDWNPAYESPPNTGMAANIPDLSTFVNAWDQPFQDRPIWIAPEPQPIPKMDHDYGFVHENQSQGEYHHDTEVQASSSSDTHQHQEDFQQRQNVFPWEANVQQTPDPTRIWLDEQILLTPIDHQPSLFSQGNQQDSEYQDWDHNDKEYTDVRAHSGNHQEIYQQSGQHDHFTEIQDSAGIDFDSNDIKNADTPTYAMDLISPLLISSGRTPRGTAHETPDSNDQAEYDWSDRDLIPIQLKSSSKLNVDGLSPKIPSSPISSRRSSLSRSRRPSISSTKSYHCMTTESHNSAISSTAASTTIPYESLHYPDHSQQPLSIFAHQTLSYSKKTPYTSAAATPVRERASFLYETDERQGYLQHSGGQLGENEADKQFEVNPFEEFVLEYSFEEPLKATSSAHRHNYQLQQTQWDPRAALKRLQHTSERIMRQHGQQPSSLLETPGPRENETDDDIGVNSRTESQYALDAITIRRSPQENTVQQFYASGNSSPRTPVVRGLDYNLTTEIEAAKEQHRQQQQASLSLLQSRAAAATLLEVELDLSKSSLFNRRYDSNINDNNKPRGLNDSSTSIECSSSSAPINTIHDSVISDDEISQEHTSEGHETPELGLYAGNKRSVQELQHQHDNNTEHQNANEAITTYFDPSVIETARRRLNALTQNVSETSMSSTTTMNEQQYDDSQLDFIHGSSLDNLSRYSFPPTHFDYTMYQQTPTIDSTFGGENLELTSSTSSTLHEKSQMVDQDAEAMVQLQQVLDAAPDLTADNDTHNHDGECFNSSDQDISAWLSLTSTNAIDPTQHLDDAVEYTEGNVSIGSKSCDSEDDDDNIIISTIAYIIATDETNNDISEETTHTHTFVETAYPSSSTPYSPQSLRPELATSNSMTTGQISQSLTPQPTFTMSTPLSASALSMIPTLRAESTAPTALASDDGNTTFLSAVEGALTLSGSSSISSPVEWYTAGSSTPILNDNDSNYGSDQEHEAAISLLEMRADAMVSRSTDPAVTSTSIAATTVAPLSSPLNYTTLNTLDELSGRTIPTTLISSTNLSTSTCDSQENTRPDNEHHVFTITENVSVFDSHSVDSEQTETGSN